jgi:transcription elongation GreA/GreB family factor
MKEESAETASETLLPDRTISPHPNLVTEAGLKALELQLQQAREAYDAASTIEDVNERRRQAANSLARCALPLRKGSHGPYHTGSRIDRHRRLRQHGHLQPRRRPRADLSRIVGEDEADPKAGSISFVSPVATRLMGKAVGDVVAVGDQELEILTIS